jgi:hypothetical protein
MGRFKIDFMADLNIRPVLMLRAHPGDEQREPYPPING